VESFLDIYQVSLNKYREELCGDQVRVVKFPTATTIILSDGLSSGVKANILATMTAEIITTMLRESVDLQEVIDTVIRTLPIDKERRIAYATFSILTIDHTDYSFRTINFDNPEPFFLKNNHIEKLPVRKEKILGKNITRSEGVLEMGDFISLISDGVLYAGLGTTMNLGWGWESIAAYLESIFTNRIYAAHSAVNSVMAVTNRLYDHKPGDDATFVGVLRRRRNTLAVFTGPPLDNGYDYIPVERFLGFEGRKVVCGGTTANIVASFLKTKVETDMTSLSDRCPAIGILPGIDLVTEGILTLSGVLDELEKCEGRLELLKPAHNGIYLLTRELLSSDAIDFLVGQSINPVYQNPLLPKNISIRRHLIERISELLTRYHKDVRIEYF
jgi:hypothetical protein